MRVFLLLLPVHDHFLTFFSFFLSLCSRLACSGLIPPRQSLSSQILKLGLIRHPVPRPPISTPRPLLQCTQFAHLQLPPQHSRIPHLTLMLFSLFRMMFFCGGFFFFLVFRPPPPDLFPFLPFRSLPSFPFLNSYFFLIHRAVPSTSFPPPLRLEGNLSLPLGRPVPNRNTPASWCLVKSLNNLCSDFTCAPPTALTNPPDAVSAHAFAL